MAIIIATVQAVLAFAWMFLCMFAAFELCLYLVAAAIELIMCVKDAGWKQLAFVSTWKLAHRAGVDTCLGRNSRAFALV